MNDVGIASVKLIKLSIHVECEIVVIQGPSQYSLKCSFSITHHVQSAI